MNPFNVAAELFLTPRDRDLIRRCVRSIPIDSVRVYTHIRTANSAHAMQKFIFAVFFLLFHRPWSTAEAPSLFFPFDLLETFDLDTRTDWLSINRGMGTVSYSLLYEFVFLLIRSAYGVYNLFGFLLLYYLRLFNVLSYVLFQQNL